MARRGSPGAVTTALDTASGKAGKARIPLTPKRAKRVIAVGTAVAPLLAPYAIAAAGAARQQWDNARARRLGVSPEELPKFSGRGATLHARLYRASTALGELAAEDDARDTTSARHFARSTQPRVADLSLAVRAAEQMPGPRRRTAFTAVSDELDRIEHDLLAHLGVAR